MGIFKKGLKKTFVSTPLRVIAVPARVAVPKAVVQTHKYYVDMLKKSRAFRCPSCGDGQLIPLTESELPKPSQKLSGSEAASPPKLSQVWECNNCLEKIETNSHNIHELAATLSQSGREFYENGHAYQARQDALEDGRLLQAVESKIKTARGLIFVVGIAAAFFLVGVFRGGFMFSITALLFAALIQMMAIMLAYRAWQLYTDNVFVADPKEQFHWWLANEKWFVYPDGYITQLNAYFDTQEDYEDEYVDEPEQSLTAEQVYQEYELERAEKLTNNKFLNQNALNPEYIEDSLQEVSTTTNLSKPVSIKDIQPPKNK